jgi:nicotinamidase-related amidase
MKALLIIDMLNDFILENAPLKVEGGKELAKRIKNLKEVVYKENIPVIYICDSHKEMDSEFKLWPKHCIEGSYGAEVYQELRPTKKDFIIRKRRYSGFFQTDLDLTLRELNVKEIILTGLVTNICVMCTAIDAAMLGYKIIVVEDCTIALNKKDHEWAINFISSVLGGVVKKLADFCP